MDDFDINAFAKMFDAAIASDNPAVRKALRNFMMIAAITESEYSDSITGPFQSLFSRLDELERQIRDMKYVPSNPYYTPPYPQRIGVGTASQDAYTSSVSQTYPSMSELEITTMMKELKVDSYWSANDVGSLEKALKDFNAK
jgi:hypothetical protein